MQAERVVGGSGGWQKARWTSKTLGSSSTQASPSRGAAQRRAWEQAGPRQAEQGAGGMPTQRLAQPRLPVTALLRLPFRIPPQQDAAYEARAFDGRRG